MKKTASVRPLSLQRETVMPLQAVDLDQVNGGLTPALSLASLRFCSAISGAALGSAQRSCLTCRC